MLDLPQVCVIAQAGHGKSTLMAYLAAAPGVFLEKQAGDYDSSGVLEVKRRAAILAAAATGFFHPKPAGDDNGVLAAAAPGRSSEDEVKRSAVATRAARAGPERAFRDEMKRRAAASCAASACKGFFFQRIAGGADGAKHRGVFFAAVSPGLFIQRQIGSDELKCRAAIWAIGNSRHPYIKEGKRATDNDYQIRIHTNPHDLLLSDGALVVIDYAEDVCAQTETFLRKALSKRIRPLLTLNKIDRCFWDRQVDGEEAYITFRRVVEKVNAIIATSDSGCIGDMQVSPEKGTVAFSSGLHGWAFTLANFAKMYASKWGEDDESKVMERLWGENFFDPATNQWTPTPTASPTCKRGFVHFCYDPIAQFINDCKVNNDNDKKDVMLKMEEAFCMKLDEALLGMMRLHIFSPSEAKVYFVVESVLVSLNESVQDFRRCMQQQPYSKRIRSTVAATPVEEEERGFTVFGPDLEQSVPKRTRLAATPVEEEERGSNAFGPDLEQPVPKRTRLAATPVEEEERGSTARE